MAAPAPAPAPAEAVEAAPTKAAAELKAEVEHAGAAPKTADDDAAAKAAPATTTAPVQTQEAAADAGGDEGGAKKDPPPADSVISARLRELLEETDLEKTSGERERTRNFDWIKSHRGGVERSERDDDEQVCWLARRSLSLALCCFVPLRRQRARRDSAGPIAGVPVAV